MRARELNWFSFVLHPCGTMPYDQNAADALEHLSEMLTCAFQVVHELKGRLQEDASGSGASEAGSPRNRSEGKKLKKKSKKRMPVPVLEQSPVLPFTVPEEEAIESYQQTPALSDEDVSLESGGVASGPLPSGTDSRSASLFASRHLCGSSEAKRSRRAQPRPQGRAQTSQSANNSVSGPPEIPEVRAVRTEGRAEELPGNRFVYKKAVIVPSSDSSDDVLNKLIFDAAGINIQRVNVAAGPKVAKAVSIVSRPQEELPCSSVTPADNGAASVPVLDAAPAETAGADQEPLGLAKGSMLRSTSPLKPIVTLGSLAQSAIREQEEQAVATLQAEAKAEHQVFGREVMWSPSQGAEDKAKRGCRSQLVRMGAHIYATLIKLGGLSPLWPEWPLASRSYAFGVLAVVTWAAVHPLVLTVIEPPGTVLYTELPLTVGATISFIFLTIQNREWALAETSQRLSVMAYQAGFLNALARSSSRSTWIISAFALAAGGVRLATFLSSWELMELDADLPLLISSLVTFFTLASQALYLHRIAAALTGTVDYFTLSMVKGESAAWGRDQWKLTLALCTDVNNKLQRGLLVLQLMLTAFLPMLAFDVKIRATSFLHVMPGIIMAAIVLSAFGSVSVIANQCQSIPSLLGRLPVQDESHDAGLISLMTRIRDTSAPVQILGVGITPGLVCKTFYTVGTVTIFLVLNFQKELGSFSQ